MKDEGWGMKEVQERGRGRMGCGGPERSGLILLFMDQENDPRNNTKFVRESFV
jgi:hypothetical protein